MEYLDLLWSLLPYILAVGFSLLVFIKLIAPRSGWSELVAVQVRRPTTGIAAWFVKRALLSKNKNLEENAVRLCRLEKQHKVLEVGFGPGLGLKAAAGIVEAGHGKVHGIDFSCEMMRTASKLLEEEVIQGKVELVLGDAACLPYQDDIMDRIFHCNCYYFWPDVEQVCRELYRVLKPGGYMITTLNLAKIKRATSCGFTKYGKCDPEPYMDALRKTGFQKVEMKEKHCEESKDNFQSIFAEKSGK